jgi:hypothetical protein
MYWNLLAYKSILVDEKGGCGIKHIRGRGILH